MQANTCMPALVLLQLVPLEESRLKGLARTNLMQVGKARSSEKVKEKTSLAMKALQLAVQAYRPALKRGVLGMHCVRPLAGLGCAHQFASVPKQSRAACAVVAPSSRSHTCVSPLCVHSLSSIPYPLPHPLPLQHELGWVDEWEINPQELQLLSKIGSGEFGDVFRAKWHGSYVSASCAANQKCRLPILPSIAGIGGSER